MKITKYHLQMMYGLLLKDKARYKVRGGWVYRIGKDGQELYMVDRGFNGIWLPYIIG